jgi:hypothetical protein
MDSTIIVNIQKASSSSFSSSLTEEAVLAFDLLTDGVAI